MIAKPVTVSKAKCTPRRAGRKSDVVRALEDTLADVEELQGHIERLHYNGWAADLADWSQRLADWRAILAVPRRRVATVA